MGVILVREDELIANRTIGVLDNCLDAALRSGIWKSQKERIHQLFAKTNNMMISLHNKQLFKIAFNKGCKIQCMGGRIWVTAEGIGNDHDLKEGEQVMFRGNSEVVVMGIGDGTTVQVGCN